MTLQLPSWSSLRGSVCLQTCIGPAGKMDRWCYIKSFSPLTSSKSHQEATDLSLALRSSLVATHCLQLMAGSTTKSSQRDKVIWSQGAKERERERESAVWPYILIIQWWENGLKIKTNGECTAPRLLTAGFGVVYKRLMKQGWLWERRLTAVLSTDL